MAGNVPVSQGTKLLSTAEKTRAPYGWWQIGQDAITLSCACSFAPHSQTTAEAVFICALLNAVAQLRLSLIRGDLGEDNPNGTRL